MCASCREKLRADTTEIPADELLTAIRECCCRAPGFITHRLPVLESVFRLFLANNNQPLELEELGKQLGEWRGDDAYRTSTEVLARLLNSDRYYGLRPVKE
ncbi:MAG: hypothetical protein E3J67_03685 [Dehalococcoidia bacterium]|nr:MAG: hypothetical protein E3J67_03685 [Dehalococcoidia bacterium]